MSSRMEAVTKRKKRKPTAGLTFVGAYDIAADAKKRISLRRPKAKYFHVHVFSNGSYLLEPRVLMPLKVHIDNIEGVQPPERLWPLMKALGEALDRLPA